MLLWATLLDHKMPSSPQTCLPAGTKILGKSATQYHLLTALRASVPRYLLSISLQASFSEDWLALQCPLLVRGLGNLTFVETSILSDFYSSWNFMRSHQFLVTGEYVNWNEGENHNGKNKCLHKRILSLPYIYLQSRYHWFGWQLSFCRWHLPMWVCLWHFFVFSASSIRYSEYNPKLTRSFAPLQSSCPGTLKPPSLTTFHIQG